MRRGVSIVLVSTLLSGCIAVPFMQSVDTRVVDAITHKPIAGVEVTVAGPEGRLLHGTTGVNGRVSMTGIARTFWCALGLVCNPLLFGSSVRFEAKGYVTKEVTMTSYQLAHGPPPFEEQVEMTRVNS